MVARLFVCSLMQNISDIFDILFIRSFSYATLFERAKIHSFCTQEYTQQLEQK